MASERTNVTELGTAAGMVLGDAHPDLDLLNVLDIPGVAPTVWRPWLEPAAEDWHRYHHIFRAALGNGAAFRETVLRGRDPESIIWRGGTHTMWVSDAPADLLVNDVLHVSAKYDSKCLLNRAPAALFRDLLMGGARTKKGNWYVEVAAAPYQQCWIALVDALREDEGGAVELPSTATALSREDRGHLKYLLKRWTRTLPPQAIGPYRELCAAVSVESARMWQKALSSATETAKLGMLAQMLRICGTTYWLLGQSDETPIRCRVTDTTRLRQNYRLRGFEVRPRPDLGQPQVDWTARLEARGASGGAAVEVHGFCEIRWSHGKFQGHPECKVQLRTPVMDLPGYAPL